MLKENEMSQKNYWENRSEEIDKEIEESNLLAEINNAEDLSKYKRESLELYIAEYTKTNKDKNYSEVIAELNKRSEKDFWNKWTEEYYNNSVKGWNEALKKLQKTVKNPNKLKMRLEKETGIKLKDIKKAGEKYKN